MVKKGWTWGRGGSGCRTGLKPSQAGSTGCIGSCSSGSSSTAGPTAICPSACMSSFRLDSKSQYVPSYTPCACRCVLPSGSEWLHHSDLCKCMCTCMCMLALLCDTCHLPWQCETAWICVLLHVWCQVWTQFRSCTVCTLASCYSVGSLLCRLPCECLQETCPGNTETLQPVP